MGEKHPQIYKNSPCGLDYAIGFGGKFGVQTDRQDSSALGWNHVEKVEKHESQKGEEKSPLGLSICRTVPAMDSIFVAGPILASVQPCGQNLRTNSAWTCCLIPVFVF